MASRPWDNYPLWKKILLAPLIPFHGVAPKKVTVYGMLFSILGTAMWGTVFVLEPIAECLNEENPVEKTDDEIAQEIEQSKNVTAFESERDRCLGVKKCLDASDSTIAHAMFEDSMKTCEPYLTNSTDPHGAGVE